MYHQLESFVFTNFYLLGYQWQSSLTKNVSRWSAISFYLAVIINFLVALFYPFDKGSKLIGGCQCIDIQLLIFLSPQDGVTMQASIVIWLLLLLSLTLLLLGQKPWRILVVVITMLCIIRCIITLGIQPTLWLLGLIQV